MQKAEMFLGQYRQWECLASLCHCLPSRLLAICLCQVTKLYLSYYVARDIRICYDRLIIVFRIWLCHLSRLSRLFGLSWVNRIGLWFDWVKSSFCPCFLPAKGAEPHETTALHTRRGERTTVSELSNLTTSKKPL